jgi:outer membrane protein OmpA-like peptidoglycan-associated protein
MSLRSKLLATVVLPAFSASFMMQPTMANAQETQVILAQDNSDQSSDDELLRQQQAEEQARQAAEQQRAAEEEARRQAEEQQRAAQEEARRAAEEQQRAAQQEAERQAAEQQRAAEQEARRQAEEQQRAAQEEARRAAEEQQRAAQQEAERQAAQQQKEAEEQAKRAAEQQRAEEAQAKQAAEQQKAAEEEAARQAEEQKQQAAEQAQREAAEQQKAIDAAAEKQAKDAAEQSKPEETPAPQPEPATPEEVPAAPAEQKPAPQPDEQPAPQTQPEQPETQTPAPEVKPQDNETAPVKQPEQEAPQPGPLPEPEVKQPVDNPAPEPKAEIIDERTTEQKQEVAKNPASTDETIVLPVKNGAAILDSDKDADNSGGNQSREERRKQREQQRIADENKAPPPVTDAAAQVEIPDALKVTLPEKIEANLKEEGTRIKEAPVFVVPDTTNIINNNTVINNTVINNVTNVTNVTNVKVIEQIDNRIILETGDRFFVRSDDRPRLRRDAERTYYDQLPHGRTRETIVRPNGYEIVTIYDRYGDIVQRSRIDRDGNEYLMIYAPDYDDTPRAAIFDVGYDLPPMRLTIPVRDYIIDVATDPERDFYNFLSLPPVEPVERIYSIDEVRHSARLRDKVRRIDLDTIHFATGSSEVSLSQAKTLRKVAVAMQRVLAKDPGETFFIEGHTDAVGSDKSNLVLSDRRAESVASLLTEVYDIPAENLVTQGYGERFLKIKTQIAEQENRRVTIRRVTPLVRPVARK